MQSVPVSNSELQNPYDDFAHTGPGTLAGRFLRSVWQPVHRSVDLPKGRAKPLRIMSEDYTLYRGESGSVHLVGFRCSHRGTQLSVGTVEGDEIRCLYHGWRYDGTGRCTEQPAEKGAFTDKVNIGGVPVREHLGLIFAFFGEGEPPPFPHLPAFEGEGLIETWVEDFPCNFFQCWENSFDHYQLHYVHAGSARKGVFPRHPEMPRMEYEETEYGLLRTMYKPDMPMRVDPFIMPNTLRISVPSPNELYGYCGPWRDSYLIKVPVDDANHLFFATQLVEVKRGEEERYDEAYRRYLKLREDWPSTYQLGQEVIAGKRTLAELFDHPYLAIIEDVVAQGAQGTVADRASERLGRSDAGIVQMRRIWSREMKKLAEGKPLKHWRAGESWPRLVKTSSSPIAN